MEHVHEVIEHERRHAHDEHHRHDQEGWEGPEPHTHRHAPLCHRHRYVVDLHHPSWPKG